MELTMDNGQLTAEEQVEATLLQVHCELQEKIIKGLEEDFQGLRVAYNALQDVCRSVARCEGKSAAEWRDVAVGYQASLVETTATMNRYHADWQNAVGQVSLLQVQQENLVRDVQCLNDWRNRAGRELGKVGLKIVGSPWHDERLQLVARGEGATVEGVLLEVGQAERLSSISGLEKKIRLLETELANLQAAAEGTQRREGAKGGRPLPSGDVLAQVFWQGFESSRNPGSRVAYGELDPETRRHQEEGIQFVLDALGPHLRPADETAETLRGRLRQVSVSVDEEKAGRLRAETKVDELDGRLASERKAAELALENQKIRLESQALAARDNFLAQLTGVQSMLTEAERRARHGELMASALRFDLSEEEFQRISGECWSLMKPGAMDNGQLTMDNGGEIATTDGAVAVVSDVLPRFEVCNRCMKIPPDGIVMRGSKPYCRPCLADMAGEGGGA